MNDKIKESFEASIIGLKKLTKTMFDQLMAPIEKRSMSMDIMVEQTCVLQEVARREGRRIKVQGF